MKLSQILPYVVAIITGFCSWLGSYIMTSKKLKQEMRSLMLSNQHEIEKLMSQHKLDLESLEAKHKLDIDLLNREHQHKLELMEKEHENDMIRKEKELEGTAKYGAIKDIMGGAVSEMLTSALRAPDIQTEITQRVKEGLSKKK